MADLANTALREQTPRLSTLHRLDQVLESTVPGLDSPISEHLDINHNLVVDSKGALAYIDIFVDDFLGITQGNKARREKSNARSVAFARRCAAPPLADGPAHAPRPCITEKDEAGQHNVGKTNSIGVGY